MSDIEQIKQKVKNPQAGLVIALGGTAKALIDDSLSFLRKHLQSADEAALNHHRFSGGETLADEVIATLNTMPFLATKRVVELHQAEKLSAECGAKIMEYANSPASFSALILVFSKIDKRNKFISALDKKGLLTLFEEPKEADVLKYAARESKNLGLSIDQEALQFLVLVLNSDMVAIKSALAKLALVFEQKAIHINEISDHIVGNEAQDVFYLARLISEGRVADALFRMGVLRQERENALKFLGVLIWQFRTLVHIRHCLDQGMAERDIAKAVYVFGDRLVWMTKVAKLRTASFHSMRLCRLLECDLLLKSQKIGEPLSFIEKIIYQSGASN